MNKNIIFKISKILIALSLSSFFLNAQTSSTPTTQSKGFSTFEYDDANGWWWYREKHTKKDGKTFETKTKFTNKEKLQLENDNKIADLLEKQTLLLIDVKARLEYAFPDVAPIYTIDSKTGKKCLTNSKDTCFVFPLQAEAQQVPVLASWLGNPNPENSKSWLRWQAKYFNHLQKIALGGRFAFLKDGADAYPTSTTFVYGDSLSSPVSEQALHVREARIVDTVSSDLGIMFFLGGNTLLENSIYAYEKLGSFVHQPWDKVNILVVLPSEEAKKLLLSKTININSENAQKFWKTAQIVVRPDLFNQFKVMVTPSVVATYKPKEKDSKPFWQIISTGGVDVQSIQKRTIQFLVYNNIIDPKDMAASLNAGEIQKNIQVVAPTIGNTNNKTSNGDK